MKTNAKAKLTSATNHWRKDQAGNEVLDQVGLEFHANYTTDPDDPNKQWAKYTPALSICMTVIPEVAERFKVGAAYLLTFEAEEG